MHPSPWDPPASFPVPPALADRPDTRRTRRSAGLALATVASVALLAAAAFFAGRGEGPPAPDAASVAGQNEGTPAPVTPAPVDLEAVPKTVAASPGGGSALLPEPALAVEGVSLTVLGGAQEAAYVAGLATSGLRVGADVAREPELRATSSAIVTLAAFEVSLARAAWSSVLPPDEGSPAEWYWAFEEVIAELETAAGLLTQAVHPDTTDADATILADEAGRHLDAAGASFDASVIQASSAS